MPVVGTAAAAGGLTAVTVAGVAVGTTSAVAAAAIAVAANLAIAFGLSFATSQALGRPKAPSVSSIGLDGRPRAILVRSSA